MDAFAQLIGDSPSIQELRRTLKRLLQGSAGARRPPPILIQGETGTGKGLVARILHTAGARAAGPFVDINCAAIPDTLLEAELFGYERGAFTEARRSKPGLFLVAHRGTVFLDEIGLLPLDLQAKMLKVIEERAVRPRARSPSMSGSSAPPTRIWPPRSGSGASGRICITGWAWSV
jgi:transcriptional regulator with PAS, ATPase and Fis domain